MIKVITAPTSYPVTVAEAKEWARIDSTDSSQDGTIALIIAAMTNYAEKTLTGRAYVERTLEWSAEYFGYCIELPFPPLISVVSIDYTDSDGNAQVVPSSDYEVDSTSEPGKVRVLSGSVWPSVGRYFNPARIRYQAGYLPIGSPTDTTDRTYLPAELRMWIAARFATIYDQRGHLMDGRDVNVPRDYADGLLDSLILASRLF